VTQGSKKYKIFIWDINSQKNNGSLFMFCNIISYMKYGSPESNSKVLGDFIFLTIVYAEEQNKEIKKVFV
jgi:hypothetical protein